MPATNPKPKPKRGAPEKLTAKQWTELKRRSLGGEGYESLSRAFRISTARISERIGPEVSQIKAIAGQVINTRNALNALPAEQRALTLSLVAHLTNISSNLASAASFGAMTAHRLSAMAHKQTDHIDETDPLGLNITKQSTQEEHAQAAASRNALQAVNVLTATANEAAKTGINLLAANKDGKLKTYAPPSPIDDDAIPNDPVEAARAYQRLITGG